MVDLHCHILPGIDDGPATIEESILMAESAIADGITHVVATPHSNSEYFFDFLHVRQLRKELQAKIGDRLKIATGCDFHLNPENLESLRKEPRHFCINQRDFLLVEFNEFSIPPAMDQALHEIQLAGVRPVITHPERNGILRAHPERLKKWVRQGCFAQDEGAGPPRHSRVPGIRAPRREHRWWCATSAGDRRNRRKRHARWRGPGPERARARAGERGAYELLS